MKLQAAQKLNSQFCLSLKIEKQFLWNWKDLYLKILYIIESVYISKHSYTAVKATLYFMY